MGENEVEKLEMQTGSADHARRRPRSDTHRSITRIAILGDWEDFFLIHQSVELQFHRHTRHRYLDHKVVSREIQGLDLVLSLIHV